MTIISLHLPKTAGTSFGASLKAHFGDSYLEDYADGGISVPARERFESAIAAGVAIAEEGLDGVACVHGHFLPAKYLRLGARHDLTFVTWMREPVARLLSHYHYWQESYDERTSRPHHRQVIEEKWTLEQFCLSEPFKNIYAQYLCGFPVERFAYIGISEYYQEDMFEFSGRFLSDHLPFQYLNPTPYASPRRRLDEAFVQKVRDFHAEDVRLYQRAMQWRDARYLGAFHHQTSNAVTAKVSDEA
jgi:hypothetical protein